MITAPHTGLTQLCDYLQNDTENFIAPTTAEITLWLDLEVICANSSKTWNKQKNSFVILEYMA